MVLFWRTYGRGNVWCSDNILLVSDRGLDDGGVKGTRNRQQRSLGKTRLVYILGNKTDDYRNFGDLSVKSFGIVDVKLRGLVNLDEALNFDSIYAYSVGIFDAAG